jgi:hypothetical protein
MFICLKCLEGTYPNREFSVVSFGPCEKCRRVGKCADVPTSFILAKDSGRNEPWVA